MINDPELNEVLGSFKEALDLVLIKLEYLEEKTSISEQAVKDLEEHIRKDIYEPAEKAFNDYVDGENFNRFVAAHGERLSPYVEPLKAVEGEDFDLNRKAYDEYNALPEEGRISEDEYIDKLVGVIESQLQAIKDKLNATEVTVHVTDEGVQVKADGQPVAVSTVPSETEVTVKGEVSPAEAEEFADAVLDDPEEVAKFERELAASLKK